MNRIESWLNRHWFVMDTAEPTHLPRAMSARIMSAQHRLVIAQNNTSGAMKRITSEIMDAVEGGYTGIFTTVPKDKWLDINIVLKEKGYLVFHEQDLPNGDVRFRISWED